MASDKKRLPWPALLRRAAGAPGLALLLAAAAPDPAAPPVLASTAAAADPAARAALASTAAAADPAARPAPAAAAPAPHGGFDLAQPASFSERRNARGGRDWRVVEPRFRVTRVVLPPRREVDLLLVQRLDSTSHSDAEGTESTLEVSGWIDGKARFDRRLWSFTAADDEGGIARFRDFYEAVKFGCCGAEDVHDYYSLTTGRQVGAATAEAVATLEIPNTPTWRMVTYHGANGQRPPRTAAPIANLLGVLNLGSDQGIERRVAVTAAGLDAWTPHLALRLDAKSEETTRLDLWAADGKPSPAGIGGCQVRLVFEDTKVLVIPLAAGDFDLAHATLPAGFHLVRVDG